MRSSGTNNNNSNSFNTERTENTEITDKIETRGSLYPSGQRNPSAPCAGCRPKSAPASPLAVTRMEHGGSAARVWALKLVHVNEI